MRAPSVALLGLALLVGCQQAAVSPTTGYGDAGSADASIEQDAGAQSDASISEKDAGGALDAGVALQDAGETVDAGEPVVDAGEPVADAGMEADAGAVTPDAGEAPDAGEPVDAGVTIVDAGTGTSADACTGKTVTAGSYDWSIMSGGMMRQLHVHVPVLYDPTQPTPVVFNFHGVTSNPADIERQSQMTPVSDEDTFIVVYPAGINGSFNAGECCELIPGIDDVAFTSDMIDYLETELCVDPKRIYATGLSNGGMMAHRLACELSNRIAAIAPVAAVNVDPTCTPGRAVPVMHFHGMDDFVVPYYGGLYQSVPSSINEWLMIDQCASTSQTTYQNGDATCDTHNMCATSNMEVTLCTISDGGHTWPGGDVGSSLGKTSHAIDASRYMWTFFAAHPMP